VRGYADLNPAATTNGIFSSDTAPHFLGPVILAQRNRPVRVKFTNNLVANSSFFIPVDTSIMGAGTGADGSSYSNNRAGVHLHGGATPWISDGTPHQWTVPAGETTHFLRGVSTRFVPDMWYDPITHASVAAGTPGATNDPGPGSLTLFYTNQQSGRMMFYHDHAYGITRLNVYAGEAAGYLLHDSGLDALIATGTIPDNHGLDLSGLTTPPFTGGLYTYGIPLIIQDKTFVPPATQLAAQDPTWNWGSEGNLWFPHVYMPNQAPDNPDNSGVNPMGRWDLGSWFWPPMSPSDLAHLPVQCGTTANTMVTPGYPATSMCPPTPNPSLVPEAFMDTPVINGQAYPTVTLKQGTYRFQVLNAANDRMFNMSLFYAAGPNGDVCNPNYVGVNNLGATSVAPAQSLCTEVKMVAANPHPLVMPVVASTETPKDLDDTPACATTLANPDVIRGSGFLVTANPLALDYNSATGLPGKIIPCWPSSWPTDGRDGGVPDPTTAGPPWIQIGTEGGVLPQAVVIPATPVGYNYNRRDIVVTNVQEHALFLGPAERADVIVDLAQVPVGSTLILYNDSPAPVPGFDSRLDTYTGDPDQTLTGGAPTTQPGYGPNIRTMMQIRVTAGTTTPFNITNLTNALPTVFAATQPTPIIPEKSYNAVAQGGTPAADTYARIQNMSLTYTPIGGTAITQPLGAKAIHELFESDYGRMNSILGTEVPLTTFTNQTTIPLAYVDPPTEILNDGQVQLWKITHNGVDSHAIHFHLVNVQLINRVGWDGAIRPPDPNEIGWKETVRMNPLEDAIIAMKPVKMTFPFAIPESVRLLDPTRPQYATNPAGMPGFTNIDPYTNNGVTTVNDYTNFGWEYVWHCHLLGHEENDMMRPLVFKVAVPLAPFSLTATLSGVGSAQQVNLSWQYTQGTTLATQFIVMRSVGAGAYSAIGAPIPVAGPMTFVDTTVVGGNTYNYQVFAQNGTSLSAQSNTVSATPAVTLNPPTGLAVSSKTATQVILGWTAPVPVTGGTVTGYVIQRAPNVGGAPGTWAQVGTSPTPTFRNTGLTTATTYWYRVQATGTAASSAFTAPISVTTN
jgi:FtsP/CotA-like multicopper oxidase with cupredoxin domain